LQSPEQEGSNGAISQWWPFSEYRQKRERPIPVNLWDGRSSRSGSPGPRRDLSSDYRVENEMQRPAYRSDGLLVNQFDSGFEALMQVSLAHSPGTQETPGRR